MICPVCLHRRIVARDLWPRRRPLYVRCQSCKMRSRARWEVARAFMAVAFGAVFAIALASGYVAKLAWDFGLVWR